MPHQSLHNEKQLIARMATGDEEAFIQLHNHYWDTVYYAGLSFLKSPDRALDAVQDIFMKLWDKRETLPSIERFNVFFMVMVRNELINALQKKARREEIYKAYQQELPHHFMLPDEKIEYKELEQLITSAIKNLPEQQQTIYRLTREEGLSHAEVADKMGLSSKTVANNITKILNYLREYLITHGKAYGWLLFLFL